MKVRELFAQANVEKIATELADDLLQDVIMQHTYKKEDLVNKLLGAVKEICAVKPTVSRGEELKVLKVFDYNGEFDEERFDVLLKMPNDGERYGIDMMLWRELVSLKVADLSFEKYDRDDIAQAILHEMTFFGYTEAEQSKRLKEETKILEERIAEASSPDAKFYTMEEVYEHLGLELPKRTEEEEECHSQKLRKSIIKNNRVYEEFGFTPIPLN